MIPQKNGEHVPYIRKILSIDEQTFFLGHLLPFKRANLFKYPWLIFLLAIGWGNIWRSSNGPANGVLGPKCH